jgi:hypothetical protein
MPFAGGLVMLAFLWLFVCILVGTVGVQGARLG